MVQNPTIDLALKRLNNRAPYYRQATEYYHGDHRSTMYMSQEYASNYAALFAELRCNVCERVVDALVDRLTLEGFTVGDDSPSDTQDQLDTIWKANRMDRLQGEAHVEACKTGDAYLIVWPDSEGVPQVYVNSAGVVTVLYDEQRKGVIKWASKVWQDEETGKVRLNLYYPDRIEKYITRTGKVGDAFRIPDGARALEWYEAENELPQEDNQWGQVPVFHLGNNAGIGKFGYSELHNIIPLQDALNKAFMDKMVSMEFDSYRQRYVTGLTLEKDEATGKLKQPFKPGRDRMLFAENENTKFGEFSAGDPRVFNDIETGIIMHIARVSATPLHYMMMQTGQFPSGVAMRTAEAPFLAKWKDRTVAFGNAWEDAFTLALRMAGVQNADIEAKWAEAVPVDRKEEADTELTTAQAANEKAKLVGKREAVKSLYDYEEDELDELIPEDEPEPTPPPIMPTFAQSPPNTAPVVARPSEPTSEGTTGARGSAGEVA